MKITKQRNWISPAFQAAIVSLALQLVMISAASAAQDACLVPDNAIFFEETNRHAVPPDYQAGVVWFAALTTSGAYSESVDGQAGVAVDAVTVYENCGQGAVPVMQEGYDSWPTGAQWWGWYYRNPWFGNNDTHEPLIAAVVDGSVVIPVSSRPDRVAHWWTERFTVKQGCQYSVEARVRITGKVSLNIGMDWWRTLTALYNGYDESCVSSNNCEAWLSDWFSSTGSRYLTLSVPRQSYCEDIARMSKKNLVPTTLLLEEK